MVTVAIRIDTRMIFIEEESDEREFTQGRLRMREAGGSWESSLVLAVSAGVGPAARQRYKLAPSRHGDLPAPWTKPGTREKTTAENLAPHETNGV